MRQQILCDLLNKKNKNKKNGAAEHTPRRTAREIAKGTPSSCPGTTHTPLTFPRPRVGPLCLGFGSVWWSSFNQCRGTDQQRLAHRWVGDGKRRVGSSKGERNLPYTGLRETWHHPRSGRWHHAAHEKATTALHSYFRTEVGEMGTVVSTAIRTAVEFEHRNHLRDRTGVPCKQRQKRFILRTGIGEMAPVGEVAPRCQEKR